MKHFLVSFLLLAAILQSCSGYNKVVRSDDFTRKFEMANSLYEKKQYARSIPLYEQVYQRMPKTGEGEVSYYRVGKAYFEEENFIMASYYLSTFSEKYPASPKCEETAFLATICAVRNSPNYTLDQNETELALNDLQMFINQYPYSDKIDTCNVIMDNLRFKLEKKEFEGVKLYSKMENYKAASVSAETFLAGYPQSRYREQAGYIMVKNSYFLAINSVESKKMERYEKAIERYRNFVAEFPSSSYRKEVEGYFEKLNKGVVNITSSQK